MDLIEWDFYKVYQVMVLSIQRSPYVDEIILDPVYAFQLRRLV